MDMILHSVAFWRKCAQVYVVRVQHVCAHAYVHRRTLRLPFCFLHPPRPPFEAGQNGWGLEPSLGTAFFTAALSGGAGVVHYTAPSHPGKRVPQAPNYYTDQKIRART